MTSIEHIALLAGGESAEREVSFASGQQVALALALAGYQPVLIDPAEVELKSLDWSPFDCCFIALHGGAGEDGQVQAELDALGIPYTGSSAAASRLAMSKTAAKERFAECGVPTLPQVVINRGELSSSAAMTRIANRVATLEYPLVIKPDSQGSSLGVHIAQSANDLPSCLAAAAEVDSQLIAERWIDGREFTIALVGRDPLPMIEIVAPQSVFTYDAKYKNTATEYRFESHLPPSVSARMYEAANAAAEAIGTNGLVRVDLMLDQQNQPWVLELNTIPGMTARSLAPRAARAAGFELPALVDWMVREALQRHSKHTSKTVPTDRATRTNRIRKSAIA